MKPLLKHLWYALRYDELAVRRWSRALVLGLATGATGFADALTDSPEGAKWIRIAGATAALIAGAITAGERNPPQAQP